MTARVSYRREWEAEFLARSDAVVGVARRIERETVAELKRGGLDDDVPAREYLEELRSERTRTGGRVVTFAERAHFVEWGTLLREPDAPMRAAAIRVAGRLVTGRR